MFPIRSNVAIPLHAKRLTATVALVLLNVGAFLYETSLPRAGLDALVNALGMIPARETFLWLRDPTQLSGWLLPILTAMFLHGGWAHLVGNMLFLWVFGRALESRIGSARFAALYLLSGFAAAQFQVLAAPWSQLPMIGASGAVAGVLGAYLVLFPRSSVTVLFPVVIFPLFFNVPALLFLGFWFLEQLWAGALWSLSPLAAQAGGVAWWAHVGGFLAGAALVITMAIQLSRTRRRTRLESARSRGGFASPAARIEPEIRRVQF